MNINSAHSTTLPAKQNVLGVGISRTSYQEVVQICNFWIEQKRSWLAYGCTDPVPYRGRYICVTSVHGIMTASKDAHFREILNDADIATPDGMPVVWALRSFGAKNQARVYGPTLMLQLCKQAAQQNHRIYLYGGRPDTLAQLQTNLSEKFPDLVIAGSYSPPFRPLTANEETACIQRIKDSAAEIVFVGISTPKQEKWIARVSDQLPGVIFIGVGAAFDFHAGRVKQAPAWMQRSGLEWLFRLASEPRRLWRRYLLTTPLFLPLWGLQRIGLISFSDPIGKRPGLES